MDDTIPPKQHVLNRILIIRFFGFLVRKLQPLWLILLRFLSQIRAIVSVKVAKFRVASPKDKWTMIRVPILVLISIFLIVTLGNLFLPPKISVSYPGTDSQENPLNTHIDIVFDRGMFKSLVEKNITISPPVSGKFSWEGDQKITFTPDQPLARSQTYAIEFGPLILSKFFIPGIGNRAIVFTTLGNPKVALASPQYEALVDMAPITVVFDRPMIPLTTATNSGVKQPAFSISPALKGDGRWLGTTAYQFRPSQRYRQSTNYTVSIKPGLTSQDGGIMSEGYSWQFSGPRPRIVSVSPAQNELYASPTASVSATFNQNLDRKTISDKFLVTDPAGQRVPGRYLVTGSTVGFYASSPLRREVQYNVLISQGVLGEEGTNGMENDYSWSFNVAPKPGVTSTSPENNAGGVNEQNIVEVFFKSPMDEKSFKDNILITPPPDKKPTWYFSSYGQNNTLNIYTYLGRSAHYQISIGTGARDQYGSTLEKPYTFSFDTAPYLPSISISPPGTYFAAFNQTVTPRIITQVINSNQVNYSLFRLKREDLLDLYQRRYGTKCNGDQSGNCYNWQSYDTAPLEKIRSWSESFQSDSNVPVNVVTKLTLADGNNLPAGYYYLDAGISQGPHDNIVLIVTRTTLTTKKSDNQIFVWSVDQSTGNVVPGMKVQLTDMFGSVLTEGTTNGDGVFVHDVNLFQKNNLLIFGQKDDDVVLASDSWNSGITNYDFGLPSYYDPSQQKDYQVSQSYKLFVTLDRPIYRPGQKVYFKGVIRKDNDGAYENLPPGEKVAFSITDAMNRSVFTDQLPLNSFGSFSGQFDLSSDANLGNYQTSVTYRGNTFTQGFQVEEYRKPDLALAVKPNKDAFVSGETAAISVNAAYYFGAPVADTPVLWTLQTQDYTFRWDKDQRFEFGDSDSYWSQPWWYYSNNNQFFGQQVTQGKGTTDSKGELVVNIPLDISKKTTSQQMSLEATVNDLSNQSIAASQQFTVHKSQLYVGVHPQSYSNQSGRQAGVELVTIDLKGKEVPGKSVTVDFNKRTWNTVREQNPDDGNFYYTNKPIDSLVNSVVVTTDDLGRALASFTPSEGGTYKVTARVTDDLGNPSISSSFLWVSGTGFSGPRENNDRIPLVTDKQDYLVGENASLFVASPYASESAKTLLTVERGSVLDYRVVDASETSNNFNIAIPAKYTPNAFITATLIHPGNEVKKPAEFKMGVTEIKVTDKQQQIDVQITTDKKRYQPRDTMQVDLVTRDLLGNPVSAEIAVGLVDKAVWDLSRVELADIYKTFYQPRNLDVVTSELLTISMDRINANMNLGAKGGSGGGGGGGMDTSRQDFPDTAYWNAHLTTDSSGKAHLTIKLPDSLTTWRLAAIANTSAAAFGSNTASVVVSRDVLIRPFLPRFLLIGDQAKIGAIIVNTSGQDQSVNVKITGNGIQIVGQPTVTSSLSDGAQTKLLWDTVAMSTSSAQIKITVAGAGQSTLDSAIFTLPVKSYSTPETVAVSGQAKDTGTEKIVLPPDLDPTNGQAIVSLSPSLGSSSLYAMSYLQDYPYYCAEQITSRLIPALYVNRVLKSAHIDSSGLISSSAMVSMINDSLQRLNNNQHPDGGWGWWTEYPSDPYLSAYAYLGLSEAKKDNYPVADLTLNQARSYLTGQLSGNGGQLSLDNRAFILYVLRDSPLNLSAYASNLFMRRFELTLESRAYLYMAMHNMGGMGGQSGRLFNEIVSLAKKTATTTHWEESKRGYVFLGDNTTTTAAVLEAITLENKNNPLIPEVVRYLMSIRRDGRWAGTLSTSAVIKAITGQLLAAGDQSVNENYRFNLNDKVVTEGKFTKNDLFTLQNITLGMSDLKIGGETQLQFTKSGQGNLYYNIDLRYYLPFTQIQSLDQGFVIVREFVDPKGNVLPGDSISENTEVWIRLIIVAPEDRHFVTVEDILPAGLESVNQSLKNVSTLNNNPPPPQSQADQLYYFQHQELHDDRTTLFADYLPAGVYEITYRARATTPGRYHYPPAQIYQMYTPDVSGHSDGGWLTVKPQP